MTIAQRKAIRIARDIYCVNVVIKKLEWAGAAVYTRNTIEVSMKQTPRQFICTIFHELGHIHCYRNNIYPAYHHEKCIKKLTKKEKHAVMLTAWKAERYVDAWGRKEMQKHFPGMKYESNYMDEIDKNWLHEHYLKPHYKQ